jgi:hypothetical protein
MFANSQMGGIDLGFPDVCMTPMGPTPVPVPYPNITMGPLGVPPVAKVLFGMAPSHNMATTMVTSMGDNPGVATGVASGTVMGPTRHVTAAFTVLLTGLPATRMTSVGIQNNTNTVGMRIAPSQVKVLLLAP